MVRCPKSSGPGQWREGQFPKGWIRTDRTNPGSVPLRSVPKFVIDPNFKPLEVPTPHKQARCAFLAFARFGALSVVDFSRGGEARSSLLPNRLETSTTGGLVPDGTLCRTHRRRLDPRTFFLCPVANRNFAVESVTEVLLWNAPLSGLNSQEDGQRDTAAIHSAFTTSPRW